ncbi:hypothetical protein [Mesorhizobium sp. WSM3879]|uniref:hypothetical protein n=1 Tax=Mesorhizobium sp. WSM3879 TaxID=2029406 RepID=UPI0011811153|nr:hypothetical protein [Mesorhizobium sp. WSM3879]
MTGRIVTLEAAEQVERYELEQFQGRQALRGTAPGERQGGFGEGSRQRNGSKEAGENDMR